MAIFINAFNLQNPIKIKISDICIKLPENKGGSENGYSRKSKNN